MLVLILAASAGCQSSQRDLVAFLKAHEHDVSAIDYRVGIPDTLAITAPQVLEIDGESQTIQPDGKVALRLLGPVKVVGMTEREIAAKLTRLLSPYYEDPKVQVRVANYRSKRIYLYGQVSGSGQGGSGGGGAANEAWISLPYTGRDTVLDVLAQTGLSFIAWRSQVRIIRSSPIAEERRDILVDVAHMMTTGDTAKNVLLQPNDIVYVPPTPLGWLGLRIQEVLFPFQPVMNAYATPATVMGTTDYYQNHNDEEND
jgi:protein involved in polysaccharide export with SLBB domain